MDGPTNNGLGVNGWLHDGLPTVRDQRAADKNNGGELIGRRQFAQRV